MAWDGSDRKSFLDTLTPVAANPFDAFDAPAGLDPAKVARAFGANAQVVQPRAAAPAANPFDQFDRAPEHDGALGSLGRGIVNGATANFAEPIVSALQATFGDINPTSQADDWMSRYHENLAANRGALAADQADHSTASLAGNIAGGFALPIGKINSVASAARAGLGMGAAYGLGQGVTDDQGVGNALNEAGSSALTGALTGAALGKAGQYLSNTILPKVQAITSGALKGISKAAYKRLDENGVRVSSDALNALGDSAVDKFAPRMGMDVDPDVAQAAYPKTHAMLKLLSNYGTEGKLANGTMSFTNLDNTRRTLATLAGDAMSSDKYMARQVLDHMDNFVDRLRPEHLDTTGLDAARADLTSMTGQKGYVAGQIKKMENDYLAGITDKYGTNVAPHLADVGTNAPGAISKRYLDLKDQLGRMEDERQGLVQAFQGEQSQLNTGAQSAIDDLHQARDTWKRYAKSSQLEALVAKAKQNSGGFGQSGYENALRRQFMKLANNDRAMSRFNPQERAAISQVATGGSRWSATNMMRDVGRLAPQGAIPMILEGGGLATAAATGVGLPAAIGVPVAGMIGRYGATRMQRAAAQRAIDIAAMGPKNAPLLNAVSLNASPLQRGASRAALSLPRLAPSTLAAMRLGLSSPAQ